MKRANKIKLSAVLFDLVHKSIKIKIPLPSADRE